MSQVACAAAIRIYGDENVCPRLTRTEPADLYRVIHAGGVISERHGIGVRLGLNNQMTQQSGRSSWPSSFDGICQAMHGYALGRRSLFGILTSPMKMATPSIGGW
jgi:hypothetical protein